MSVETKRDAGEERCGPRGPGRPRASWGRLLLSRHSPLLWGPGRPRAARWDCSTTTPVLSTADSSGGSERRRTARNGSARPARENFVASFPGAWQQAVRKMQEAEMKMEEAETRPQAGAALELRPSHASVSPLQPTGKESGSGRSALARVAPE